MALKTLLIVCQILHVSYISSWPDYIWGNGTHFRWHKEESWLFSLPKEALAQLIYCLSRNYFIQQWFIELLLYMRCSLKYVAFYSTWHMFSPVAHMTTLHVRVWWRSWTLYDGWRNWCLDLLALNTSVSYSTMSTFLCLGPPSLSVETNASVFSPFQLAAYIAAPYAGWVLRIPPWKREHDCH